MESDSLKAPFRNAPSPCPARDAAVWPPVTQTPELNIVTLVSSALCLHGQGCGPATLAETHGGALGTADPHPMARRQPGGPSPGGPGAPGPKELR